MIKLFLGIALLVGQVSINFLSDKPAAAPYSDAETSTPISDDLSIISYSEATPDQKESVCKILEEAFRLFIPELMDNAHYKNNILISGNAVKGALIYEDYQDADEIKCRNIHFLAIDRSIRGKGYGKYLMKKNQNDAQKLGIQKIQLHSAIDAIRFYKKIGFKSAGSSVLDMAKNLQSSQETKND